jgi:AcrR family transcriptional regulator
VAPVAKRRIDLELMVKQAAAVVDGAGRDELSIGRVAEGLGVQPSALYNHIDGIDGLVHDLAVHSTDNLATYLLDAVVARSGTDAVRALAIAYRGFALEHPGQYAAKMLPPAGSDDSLGRAHDRIVDVFNRVLCSVGYEGDEAVHVARLVRSAIHGFVSLETIGAMTSDVDRETSFTYLIDFLVSSLEAP